MLKKIYPYQAFEQIGDTLKNLKNYESSLCYYQKALKVQHNNPYALLRIGDLFLKMQRFDLA